MDDGKGEVTVLEDRHAAVVIKPKSGRAMAADESIQKLLESVRDRIESQMGRKLTELKAISYRSQIVSATSTKIKAHVGNDEYIHVRVYQHWSGEIQSCTVVTARTLDEEL